MHVMFTALPEFSGQLPSSLPAFHKLDQRSIYQEVRSVHFCEVHMVLFFNLNSNHWSGHTPDVCANYSLKNATGIYVTTHKTLNVSIGEYGEIDQFTESDS